MKKTIPKILLLGFLLHEAHAKNVNTTGAITYFGLSARVAKYGTFNFNHSDTFNFSKKELEGEKFKAGVEETNFQINYSYQLRPSISLAGGYIYQKEFFEEKNENRLFEQVTLVKNYRNFSTTHRFRFEERFVENTKEDEKNFKTRLRYQIGGKVPLRGLVIDSGEFYFNTYNEFYFSTSGERNSFFSENWFYGAIGYNTKTLGNFEIGPTIQWVTVNENKDTRTHYTVQAGWIVGF